MEIENGRIIEPGGVPALTRAKLLSQALADAARRARVSKRSDAYIAGGFQARRGRSVMRFVVFVGFWVIVAAPSATAFIYYTFIAADQFVSEAEFTIGGGATPIADGIAVVTGLPSMSVVQDTQIVVNYVTSRAAVEKLDADLGLRKLFSAPQADWVARFNPSKPIEKFVKYWESMVDVSIKMPAGIVDVKTRAFTAQDAARIAQGVLDACESLVNAMNDRAQHDAVGNAEDELARTSARLTQARLALEKARNDNGILDTSKAADALNGLLNDARAAQMRLQQEYATQVRSISPTAPQLTALRSRIEATAGQIAEIESRLTTTKTTAGAQPALAASMTKFAELDLEREIAERLYSAAAVTLELARTTAEHKTIYVNSFVKPVAAQEARLPRRILSPVMITLLCLLIWGVLCAIVGGMRNYMA